MNKEEFIKKLKNKLSSYKDQDIEDALNYYSDLIDDKVENEGVSEEQAVASLGDVDKIARKISVEMIANNKASSNGAAKTLFIVLGCLFASPLLLPIAICALVFIFVFFILWVSLTGGFGAGAIGCLIGCVAVFFQFTTPFPILLGLGSCLIGFSVLAMLTILFGYIGWNITSAFAKSLARLVTRKGSN